MTDKPPAFAGGAPAPGRLIQKDAPWVRIILFGLGLTFAAVALLIVWDLGWHRWPDTPEVSHDRIDALKLVALLAIVGMILMTSAFASPWLGTVKISGGPIEIEGEGRS